MAVHVQSVGRESDEAAAGKADGSETAEDMMILLISKDISHNIYFLLHSFFFTGCSCSEHRQQIQMKTCLNILSNTFKYALK